MNFKKSLSIFISAAMLFSPITSVYAYDGENTTIITHEITKVNASSGTLDNNISWTLDDNGTLTISGNGAIAEGAFSDLYDFTESSSIKKVIIKNGVTGIGDSAFYECSSLTSISIPASVTSIADYVFSGCFNLATITVNANNKHYSSDEHGVLFNKNKTNLVQYPTGNTRVSYTIPSSVTKIDDWAFSYCSNLTSVTISEGVASIGNYAFYECSALTSISLPGSITNVGDSAFEYCSRLTTVAISSGVASIGDCAFYNCSALEKITVDESNKNYSSDEYGALWDKNKTKLIQYPIGSGKTSYSIPESATEIADSAFNGCYVLTDIFYGGNEDDWSDIYIGFGNDQLYNVTVHFGQETCPHVYSDWITDIEFKCETGGKKHKECSICGDVVTEVSPAVSHSFSEWTTNASGEYERLCSACGYKQVRPFSVVSSGICGNTLTWTLDVKGTLTISGIGNINEGAFSFLYDFAESSSIKNLVIEDGITGIGNYAFYECSNIASITISSSVKSIGDHAFSDCSSLASVIIPDSVVTIGGSAFSGCSSLKSLTIGNGVTNIDSSAFSGCSALTSAKMGNKVASIGSSVFFGCSSLTSITIPDSVTTIGDSAFNGCSSITSIVIPHNVTTIGEWAFFNCSNLERITVDENNKYYSNDEYGVLFNKNKTTLIKYPEKNTQTVYTIPDGVVSVSASAFQYSLNLKSVIIPNSVTSIGNSAFEYCSSLTSVTIPNSVTNIGAGVFIGCSSLAKITVDGDNKYYSSDGQGVLFNKNKTMLIQYPIGNTKTSYDVPGGVSDIGEWAFQYCSSLTYISLPNSVNNISSYAFWNCKNITEVRYDGIEDEWNRIEIADGNDDLLAATVTYVPTETKEVGLSFLTEPQKTVYTYGEDLSLNGAVIVVMYSDGSYTEIKDYTVTGYDKYSFGVQNVYITRGDFSLEFKVSIVPAEATSVTEPINEGTTVRELSALYPSYTLFVFNNDKATLLTDSAILKTGCIIQLVSDNSLIDSIAVNIAGDATGDGVVDTKDLIRIKKQILQGSAVEYIEFVDVNCDGTVDEKDIDTILTML